MEQRVSDIIEAKRDTLIELSDTIWGIPETRFEEFQSAELLCQALEQEGFAVERGVAGIETAFIGTFGSGAPVVAVLGEFDALSGLSQEGGSAVKSPVQKGGNGHGCGHNLLGTASLAAVIALKQVMEEEGIPGTVRYYGCPGEEGGSGKTYMVRAGLFDDVDFSVTWHPMGHNGIMAANSLANYQVYYRFRGISSHAAASPHLGRSALDAVELMNVGVNYLREHVIPEARMHYAVTNTGGRSPNVVQAEADVLYLIRAPKVSQVEEIYQRVCNIARGAALMTDTTVEIVFDKACSNLVQNKTLEDVMQEKFERLGLPDYDTDELAFAAALRATLSDAEKNSVKDPAIRNKDIADRISPPEELSVAASAGNGSTDVGDVSLVTPTAQCNTACWVVGTTAHTWQVVSIGRTSIAHKGMLHAGKVMAATALEVMQSPVLIEQAKAELKQRLGAEKYVSPIPPEVQPAASR
ncbi:M20 family metallopeptidase [Alicyclobacillus ferrooxydans]|uniref:Amidohydrolase n=1 Tax=Alicyclobacillus ferrooxydans TaxID=471514 RepID=A0A0P9EZE7_9BACL|nr:M20 family metallopeptidase [Alicyclobacillus ferrooxydans]KPV44470.1 amidohydrolase [Alicyclobacillus ferrooxydans]